MGDVSAGLTDMWRSILLFLPKAIAFIAILVVGWMVARAVRKLVGRALERVGFDRAVQRGGIGRALERSRYDASDVLARLAYYALLLLTLQLAFGVWGPNPVSELIAGVIAWLPLAFVAIVIVVVAAAIGSAVRDLITGALGGLSYGRLLANVASWFIIGLGVIAALNQVGIATTVTTPVLIATLATVAGILIVGVGGGLIRPMARRWDRWLERAEAESQAIRERAQSFVTAGRGDVDRQLSGGDGAEDTTMALATAVGANGGTEAVPEPGHGGATTGQAAFPPRPEPGTYEPGANGSGTYEPGANGSGNANGGSVGDTHRLSPR